MGKWFDGFDDRLNLNNGWSDPEPLSDGGYTGWNLITNLEDGKDDGIFPGITSDLENSYGTPYQRGNVAGGDLDVYHSYYIPEFHMNTGSAQKYWYFHFDVQGEEPAWEIEIGNALSGWQSVIVRPLWNTVTVYERNALSSTRKIITANLRRSPSAGIGWHTYEVYIGINIGGGSDFIYVWCDGELIIEKTAFTLAPSYPTTQFWHLDTLCSIDNIYVEWSNTPISGAPYGIGIVEALKPTANGADAGGFTPNAGTNYSCVDEIPQDFDESYNYATASGSRDSFLMEDLSAKCDVGATIKCVEGRVFCTRTASEQIKMYVLIGGTRYYSGDLTPSTEFYNYVTYQWDVNPATASAWTVADLDGLEFGYEVV